MQNMMAANQKPLKESPPGPLPNSQNNFYFPNQPGMNNNMQMNNPCNWGMPQMNPMNMGNQMMNEMPNQNTSTIN
jgi:hypothetical protein